MVSNSVQRTKEAAAATKLIGSKKQIEWASRIREKWLYIVKRELPTQVLFSFDKVRGADVSPEAIEQAATTVLAVRLAAIDDVVTHSQAAWWIDFRDHLESMVNRLVEHTRADEAHDETYDGNHDEHFNEREAVLLYQKAVKGAI